MKKLSFLIAPVAMVCMAAFAQPAMAETKSADQIGKGVSHDPLNTNYQRRDSSKHDSSKLLTKFKGGYSEAIGDATPDFTPRWKNQTRYNCRPRAGSDDHMKWCVLVGDDPKDGDIDSWSCYLTGIRGFENKDERNADAQIYRGKSTGNPNPVPNAPYIRGSGESDDFVAVGKDKFMNNRLLPDGSPSDNKIWLVVRSQAAWYNKIFTQVGWECVKFKSN